ncbi:site-specific DNA-methyltransferase [bacterium]|nr:site-specific DNA-methyltransferase [bacterium]
MEKLDPKTDGASADIVGQNIEKLEQFFPEIFSEGKIDLDILRETMGEYVDDRQERYSFNWNGKSRARLIAQTPSTGTLRPCPEESINWITTKNIFIEGDNLEVLKLLQKSYHKKIKMIYIDPPYNTGKEFIYPDKFQDNLETYLRYTGQKDEEGLKLSPNTETSGRFHTNWLNMMLPRLNLARNLLRDDGVIFISIDDNEVSNLRKLCDEIFGEENFLGLFVINSSPSAIDYGHIAKVHDYAVFYAKNIDETVSYQLPEEDKEFKYSDEIGPFNLYPLYNGNVAFNPKTRPNLYYPFYLNPENKITNDFFEISLEEKEGWIKVYPVVSRKDGIQRVWRWSKKKAINELNQEIVGYKTDSGEFRIVQKTRHTGKVIRSLFNDKEVSSRRGTAEVEGLFGSKVFSFPKPTGLIKRFIKAGTSTEDIVLDFFAGSAPTAHAVLDLNQEDYANRKFILVQLPESCEGGYEASKSEYQTIAEIAKERIRKVIKKIDAKQRKKAKDMEGNLFVNTEKAPKLDLGFKVFKLDSSNIKPWDADFDNLKDTLFNAVENIKPDRSESDVLYELLLKYGLDLAVPIEERKIDGKTVCVIGEGALIVCLANKINLEVVEGIAALKDELKPEVMRVVFKDSGFKDDVVKTNAVQILRQADIDDVKSL